MTLKEALDKSNYNPRSAVISVDSIVKNYYYEGQDVPIEYAIREDWEPHSKHESMPQAGDVWKDCNGGQCFIHWNTAGCRLMPVWRDGSVRHDIPQGMIHNRNGWKLLFRDGKAWEDK